MLGQRGPSPNGLKGPEVAVQGERMSGLVCYLCMVNTSPEGRNRCSKEEKKLTLGKKNPSRLSRLHTLSLINLSRDLL